MTIIQWYPGHMAKAKKNMEQDIAAAKGIFQLTRPV